MKKQVILIVCLVWFLTSNFGCKRKKKDYGVPDDYIEGSWNLTKILIDGVDSTDFVKAKLIPDCQYNFLIREDYNKNQIMSIEGNCNSGVFSLDKKNKKMLINVGLCNCLATGSCSCFNASKRYPFMKFDGVLTWSIVNLSSSTIELKATEWNQTFDLFFSIKHF